QSARRIEFGICNIGKRKPVLQAAAASCTGVERNPPRTHASVIPSCECRLDGRLCEPCEVWRPWHPFDQRGSHSQRRHIEAGATRLIKECAEDLRPPNRMAFRLGRLKEQGTAEQRIESGRQR